VPRGRGRDQEESVIHVLGSGYEPPLEEMQKYDVGGYPPMNYPPSMPPSYGVPYERERGYPPPEVRKDTPYHIKTERDPRDTGVRDIGGSRESNSRETSTRRRRSSSKERRRSSRDRDYDSRRTYKRSRSKSRGRDDDRSSKRSRH